MLGDVRVEGMMGGDWESVPGYPQQAQGFGVAEKQSLGTH